MKRTKTIIYILFSLFAFVAATSLAIFISASNSLVGKYASDMTVNEAYYEADLKINNKCSLIHREYQDGKTTVEDTFYGTWYFKDNLDPSNTHSNNGRLKFVVIKYEKRGNIIEKYLFYHEKQLQSDKGDIVLKKVGLW